MGRITTILLAGIVVLSALVPATFVGLTTAQESSFDSETYRQEFGDVFRMTVELSDTESAYLGIRGRDANYHVIVEVTDGNGDGQATVTLNSLFALRNRLTGGLGVSAESEAAGDEVTLVDLVAPDPSIEAVLPRGSYSARLGSGYDSVSRQVTGVQDLATLDLVGRSTTSAGALTGASQVIEFDSRSGFLEQFNATTFPEYVYPRERIAKGDFAVIRFDVSGIYGYLETRHDLTGVEATGGPSGIFVSVTRLEETDGGHLDLTDRSNVLLIDDETNHMYLVLSTRGDFFESGGAYEATLELNETSLLIPDSTNDLDRETVSTSFVITDRNASFDRPEDGGVLEPGGDGSVEIRGSTTLAPRSELELRLADDSESVEFRLEMPVTVQADGTFETSFSLTDIPHNTSVQVSAVEDETVLGRVDAVVMKQTATTTTQERPPSPTPTATSPRTGTPTGTATATATDTATDTPTLINTPTVTVSPTETNSQQTPGFTFLVAVVATVLLTLLAARRSR